MGYATTFVVLAVAALLTPATARAATPWRAADQVRAGLSDAGTDLLLGDGGRAERAVARARRAYAADLRRGIRRADPEADADARRALDAAASAARRDDDVALAAARGSARAAVLRGAYAVTVTAAQRGRRAHRSLLAPPARVPHGHALHAPRGRRHARGGAPRRAGG